jgi:hypothetical protein
LKIIFRFIILGFVCVIDVTINAEAVFLPQSCWGKQVPCAVENNSKDLLNLTTSAASVHMGERAIVKSISENEASLTLGTLFTQHKDSFKWHTPFGDILCRACEMILQRDEKSLEVHALKGLVFVLRLGDEEKYELPPGFSVLLSGIGSDGKANLDYPQASALRPLAKSWAKVYPGTTEEFKADLRAYIDSWKVAVENASAMQAFEAGRLIASADSERKRLLAIKQAHELEDQRLRNLFREKNDLH